MTAHCVHVPDVEAMEGLGRCMAGGACPGAVFLRGELGAGKTTLARGLLRGLGEKGPVRSPTFTLIEPYPFEGLCVYHLDLYRVSDPAELELIGVRDYLGEDALLLIEWPERAGPLLPPPDLTVDIAVTAHGRDVRLESHSPAGARLVAAARRAGCIQA